MDDALLEPSDDVRRGGRDVNKELDNLGLDDEYHISVYVVLHVKRKDDYILEKYTTLPRLMLDTN
jgi:hypothetical protein